MIRIELLNDINDALSKNAYFGADDFVFDVEALKRNKVYITYRYDKTYSFTVDIPTKAVKQGPYGAEYSMPGRVNPGDLVNSQEVSYSTKSDLLGAISDWVNRIRSELLAIPVYRRLEAQTQELEDLVQKFDDLPDEYFTQDEAERLRCKLDDLEAQMKQNLEQSDLGKKEIEDRLKALHTEVDILKQTVESLKKKGWVNALLIRIANWMKDPNNRALLKSGAEVAQTLLIEAGKKQS